MRRRHIIKGTCEIKVTTNKGKTTFKCKNIRRKPTAQEIISSLKK